MKSCSLKRAWFRTSRIEQTIDTSLLAWHCKQQQNASPHWLCTLLKKIAIICFFLSTTPKPSTYTIIKDNMIIAIHTDTVFPLLLILLLPLLLLLLLSLIRLLLLLLLHSARSLTYVLIGFRIFTGWLVCLGLTSQVHSVSVPSQVVPKKVRRPNPEIDLIDLFFGRLKAGLVV